MRKQKGSLPFMNNEDINIFQNVDSIDIPIKKQTPVIIVIHRAHSK